MRPAGRLSCVLTCSLFLTAALFADGPGKTGPKPKKSSSAKTEPTTKATPEPKGAATPVKPAAKSAKPAPKPRAPQSSNEPPALKPLPATSGTLGLFTLETGETIPRKAVTWSAHVNKFSREPGSISVVNLGWSIGYGLSDRLTTYVVFEPHRHVHVSRPGRLSFNSPLNNPQFGTTVYRVLSTAPLSGPGYAEDFPFVGRNGGGIGEVTAGLKFGILSERRGDPVGFSVRGDFIIPTHRSLTDLLGSQGQSGEFDFNIGAALSKTFRDTIQATFNFDYKFTRDPEFAGGIGLNRADQIRAGFGFLAFPQKRVQLMSEYSALIFTGESTQTTTFGARDPVEIVSGVRLYPWSNFAIDLGYRNVANLKAHGDRNGFVIKIGSIYGVK